MWKQQQTGSQLSETHLTIYSRKTFKVSAIGNYNWPNAAGAVPKLHGSKQVNKPDYINANWDIERAGPRALHMDLYKAETNLATQDIEGAQP